MRFIEKAPFSDFMAFVKKHKPQNWNSLAPVIRITTRKYILENEQFNQCAYTELPLKYKNNNSHIEHLKRKDSAFFPELTFEWSNLFVSCNFDDFGGKYKDMTYLKGKSRKDNELILNVSLENPSAFFDLKEYGELTIKEGLNANEKMKAKITIDAFNLNHPSLTSRRRDTMRSVTEYKNGGLGNEMIIEFLSENGFKSVVECQLNI